MRLAVLLLLAVALPAFAGDPTPEIKRDPAAPQAIGELHTLRGIPEACARLEGMFTGQASEPYKFSAVRSSPNCQARARFVDADKAMPSAKQGWIFNDLIRVPNAACATQQAVVRVWRCCLNADRPLPCVSSRCGFVELPDASANCSGRDGQPRAASPPYDAPVHRRSYR